MKYTIKDLAEGRVYVKNDGTLEELEEVLIKAFPDDTMRVSGHSTYYGATTSALCWVGYSMLPYGATAQSVKDFLWQPKRGDIVEVSDSVIWYKRIYVTTIKGTHQPFITVTSHEEENFKEGLLFGTASWVKMRKINTEVSVEEIAEKFGIPVDQLRIKK